MQGQSSDETKAAEVAQIAAGRRRGKERAIEIGLRRRVDHPSRPMIIRSDGSVYWPMIGERALKNEVMLPPWEEKEWDWSAGEVLAVIARKEQA
jgi:hypothetical protein